MPAEERRLVAEEGLYSLKTWLLKTEDQEAGWAPVLGPSLQVVSVVSSSPGPTWPPTSCCLHLFTFTDGRGWLVSSGSSWSKNPQSQPSFTHFLVVDRRLAAEEGSLPKKTWPRKILVGRRAPDQGPVNLLVKSVLLSPTKDKLHQKLHLRRLVEEDTKMGVRAALQSTRLNNYRFLTELWDEMRWAWVRDSTRASARASARASFSAELKGRSQMDRKSASSWVVFLRVAPVSTQHRTNQIQ